MKFSIPYDVCTKSIVVILMAIMLYEKIGILKFSFCAAIYFINKLNTLLLAEVVKLVDALDSKSSILRDVSVRARPSVQH